MFKEPAYWMYYFWSKNKRARKDKAVISNATWTMAILWFLNLTALHLLFEAWGWDMLTGWFSSLTDKVEWSRFNPVAYLFAAAMLAPLSGLPESCITVLRSSKAMQAKYEQWANTGNCSVNACSGCILPASFASFFIIAEQKNHSKEQPLIERLQEIRDGKYPVGKRHTHRPANDLLPAPPAYCLMPFCGWNRHSLSVFTTEYRAYGAKNPESAAQGHTVTDAKAPEGCLLQTICNFV